jgi:tetrapyrrole methylase family protein/MazG family protein
VFKKAYDIGDLLQIMSILRGENGCPWDKEQTHKSIRKNFIEETYEVIEAIDNEDTELLKEELGDVLLQVVFHTQMEKEQGTFEFSDVVNDLCNKLIERHPHIFSDTKADNSDEVIKNWEAIKKSQKGQKSSTETLMAVPKTLPALMRSTKIQQRAARAGFDYPDMNMAMDDLKSEIAELEQAVAHADEKEIQLELGDVLFSVVNVSRFLKVDSEECLTLSAEKFISRFKIVEQLAKEQNIDFKTASTEELIQLWNKAKKECDS